jgi:hypothetical protein
MAKFVDTDCRDKHMPERFVNSLFDPVALALRHLLTPQRTSIEGFAKRESRTHCRLSPLYDSKMRERMLMAPSAKALEVM